MAMPHRSRRLTWLLLLAGAGLAAASFVPLDPGFTVATSPPTPTMNLDAFSAARPTQPLRLLFIHHSIGGQLLAERGPERERASCILESHPNGGGLRARLQAEGYEVHEASYGSEIGDRTDLLDWKPKFSTLMDKILRVDENDRALSQDRKIDIVMFKSCFPNSHFVAEGEAPGNAGGPELTVWNAKAALSSLLAELAKRPKTLFVYVTAPPAAPAGAGPALKVLAKRLLGRIPSKEAALEQGRLARAFNAWIVSPDGWLEGYPSRNVVIYDLYDALTDHGKSNHLVYASGDGSDSHPTSEGNARASEALPAFLNRAVRRAGLSD